MSGKHILCTGGAGYIGCHTVVHLIKAGYKVSIVDNLCNSSPKVIPRLEELTKTKIPFYKIDLCDKGEISKLCKDEKFDAVIHYAGLKAVGESVAKPLMYYQNNLLGTLNLLEAMGESNCKVIVFSSSATVYKPSEVPLKESDGLGPSNPYGQTKFFIEQILQDLAVSDKEWKISLLRYFNPVGAHPSGMIGESPTHPQNLLPYVQQVAIGRLPHLNVFGNDWPTPDGTGVRDYLHVDDLATGHLAALNKLFELKEGECMVHNLGTGRGVSVLELVKCFEKESGKPIPHIITERRPGDLATVVADPSLAQKELSWKAIHSIDEACASSWKWQSNNPYGYDGKQE